ncbi:MAG: hypothetical protein AAGK32_18450, partial [Actinomycetota bacterium]
GPDLGRVLQPPLVTDLRLPTHLRAEQAGVGPVGVLGHEWRLEDPAEVRASDPAVTAVLEDPTLGLPTVLPDGRYRAES